MALALALAILEVEIKRKVKRVKKAKAKAKADKLTINNKLTNMEQENSRQWRGKTGGTPWMQRTLVKCMKVMNIHLVYIAAGFMVPYYMVAHHKEYLSIYRFFRRRIGYGKARSFWNVFVNHIKFSQIIVDRFAAYSGKHFTFEVEGADIMRKYESKDEGFVIISSHIGNYELAGYSMVAKKKCFNTLVYANETQTVMENRNRALAKTNMRMIPIKEDMSHIFLMNSALSAGEVVSVPGDRMFGSKKFADCLFFGEKAKFPIGAYALALQKDVELMAMFVMKESTLKYRIIIKELLLPDKALKLKERINVLAQEYACCLEKIVKKYPVQWFNYYDFWQHE